MNNDKEFDTWDRKVKIYGNPVYGKRYLCELRGYNSGNIFSVVLDAVDGGDYLWQDVLGDEINEMAFDVISWVELASTQDQQKTIDKKDEEIERLKAVLTRVIDNHCENCNLEETILMCKQALSEIESEE